MQGGCVSFFSGALGLDLGLERAGLTPLCFNEVDRHALATIRANRPGVPVLDCDVRKLDARAVRELVGADIFAVVGGPPCQSFSTAGKRGAFADSRGNVFLHFLELAVKLEPRYIVIENVRGLLSAALRHRPLAERGTRLMSEEERPGSALGQVVARLTDAGYGVSFQLYNVANFGVPQSRERVVLIASVGSEVVPHLIPTHGEHEWVSFRSAIAGLENSGAWLPVRRGRERFLELIGPGENWRSLPLPLQEDALGGAFRSSGGRVGFCRRIAWDKPCPTLVTSPTMPATELIHPEEMRPLSINEYKRVQTFPDQWVLSGRLADQYRQIGNAVPVLFGQRIGEHLLAHASGQAFDDKKEKIVSRYRNTCEKTWSSRSA